MVKKVENVDSEVIDGVVEGQSKDVKPQVSVEQILLAKAQIDSELISLVAQNNQLLREILSRMEKK